MPRPGIRPTTLSGPLTSSLSSESPSRGCYVNTIHGDSVTLKVVLAWAIEPNTVQQATLDVETEQPIASGPQHGLPQGLLGPKVPAYQGVVLDNPNVVCLDGPRH